MQSLIWLWFSLGITGLLASPLPQGTDGHLNIRRDETTHEQPHPGADVGGQSGNPAPIEPIESPLPEQSPANQENPGPQPVRNGNAALQAYDRITKDLALLGVGVLGTKVYLDHKNKPPKNGGDSPSSRKPLEPKQPAPDQRGRIPAVGFNLDDIPYHDGDEYGKAFQATYTNREHKIWEKCVEQNVSTPTA